MDNENPLRETKPLSAVVDARLNLAKDEGSETVMSPKVELLQERFNHLRRAYGA